MKIHKFENGQGSPEWLQARAGVITGTRLKSVMSSKADTRNGLICELIAEQIAPLEEKTFKSSAMERGNLVEEVIKEFYPKIENVDFITKCEWLWISPDGVEFEGDPDDEVIIGALEVKSPGAKAFVEHCLNWEIPTEYFWQVIHYFVVIDTLKYLDFVIITPSIYDPKRRKRTIRLTREQLKEKIQDAQEKIISFRAEWEMAIKDLLTVTF